MKNRHPKTLSTGDNNTVIALSETEVGKLFTGDTRSDIGSEAEKLKFANHVNGLLVGFVRLDFLNDDTEMLVMERLYPMDFRAFEYENANFGSMSSKMNSGNSTKPVLSTATFVGLPTCPVSVLTIFF